MPHEYKVIKSEYNDGYMAPEQIKKFQDYISDEMKMGWTPLGGVSAVCNNGNTVNLFQAMIK